MPDAVRPPRVIPNWQMDKPWTEPMSDEEADGLAETALLSGALPDNNGVVQLLAQFAGDLANNLSNATGNIA